MLAKAQADAKRHCRNSALCICCRWYAYSGLHSLAQALYERVLGSGLLLLSLPLLQHLFALAEAQRGGACAQEGLQRLRHQPLKR